MSQMPFMAKPCASCPWRKSSAVGGSDIPGFSIDMMRNLANTVPPKGEDSDGFRKVMACHGSSEDRQFPCAGYLHRHGNQNISVRLLMARGEVDLRAVDEACQGIEMYPDFHAMLADYEEACVGQSGNNEGVVCGR